MPIQQIESKPRIPLLGKIRLGVREEKTNRDGKVVEFPTSVEHFVLDEVPEVKRIYGDDPKEIDIMFPSDDLELSLPTYLEWWTNGKKDKDGKVIKGDLMCKGNGPGPNNEPGVAQHFTKRDPVTGVVPTRPCLGSACPDWLDARGYSKCKPTMRVTVLLPLVSPMGVYQINTTSWNSIRSFHDQVRWIQELNGGRIRMIPLKVVREAMYIPHMKDGRDQGKIHYIMKLKPNEAFMDKHGEQAKQIMAVFNVGSRYMLPSAEEVQATGMEDHFPVVEAQTGPTTQEVAKQTAEAVAADSEVMSLFEELELVLGKKFNPIARLASIRQQESSPDIKAAVVGILRTKIEEARARAQKATPPPAAKEAAPPPAPPPAEPAAPPAEPVAPPTPPPAAPKPDENGIL